MTTPTPVKVSLSFRKIVPKDLIARCLAVITGLTGNANFTNLPVDLAVLKAALDHYTALCALALDGSKKAKTERNKQQADIIKMLKLLGQYVESTCKDDPAAATSSGFVLKSNTRTSPAPLAQPAIAKIEQGMTGQFSVSVTPIPNKTLFEMRYGAAVPGGMPANWTYLTFSSTRPPQLITGLTPGTVYVFQVRAHGKATQTDWSDSATRMAI
jgi:hypothetical protein